MRNPRVVMIGTSTSTRGGVSAVVNVYRDFGLFDRWGVVYLHTHVEGRTYRKIGVAIAAIVRFAYLLLVRQVSVVHIHVSSNASFWRKAIFILMSRVARKPVLFHLHGGGFVDFYQDSGAVARCLIRAILRKVTRMVVLSDYWKTQLQGIAPCIRITPIYNPVCISTAHKTIVPRRAGQILFLGKICAEKGIYDLVSAFARVLELFPHALLEIGGDGELNTLRNNVRGLGIDHAVTIHGWVSGEAKARLLTESSILVLPSYVEGMPMALLEAMAHGLGIVATRVGAIPEILEDRREGILIEPRRVDPLLAALELLLANPCQSQRMGLRAAQKIRDRFQPSAVLPSIETIYSELMAVSPSSTVVTNRIGGPVG